MIKGKVIIIIPAYNEGDVIEYTIEGLKKIDSIDKIVIVDDGSTDNTSVVAENTGAVVISLKENRGKGYAMKKGLEEIDGDIIGFIDGDVGITSSEVVKLIEPVINDEVDFTIAKFPSASKNTNVKGGFGLVKRLAYKGVHFYTGEEMETSLSGQRVYKKEVLDNIEYIPTNYGIEVAMTVQAINKGYTFKEVPVNMKHRYTDRSFKGFKHRGKQFIQILMTLIKLYFRRWRYGLC